MGSQCNALDWLAPDCLSRHLKRWLWPNSLRCSPYTNLPAQCSPPSSKEARLRGTRQAGNQCFSSVMAARTDVTSADEEYSLQADSEHSEDEEEDRRRPDGSCTRRLSMADLHWSKLQGNVPEALSA